MKITKSQLQQIIKEELNIAINELFGMGKKKAGLGAASAGYTSNKAYQRDQQAFACKPFIKGLKQLEKALAEMRVGPYDPFPRHPDPKEQAEHRSLGNWWLSKYAAKDSKGQPAQKGSAQGLRGYRLPRGGSRFMGSGWEGVKALFTPTAVATAHNTEAQQIQDFLLVARVYRPKDVEKLMAEVEAACAPESSESSR